MVSVTLNTWKAQYCVDDPSTLHELSDERRLINIILTT